MKKISFDEEELFAIAVFTPDNRKNMVQRMERVLPELAEDTEMRALLVSAMEKLRRISDREYDKLDLDAYREDLEYAEDEESEETGEDESQKNNPAGEKPSDRLEEKPE